MKRKDFSATLKQLTDCLERMCSGNRFHSDGAAMPNERAPNFVAVLGMTRPRVLQNGVSDWHRRRTPVGTCRRGSVELGRVQLYKPVDTA